MSTHTFDEGDETDVVDLSTALEAIITTEGPGGGGGRDDELGGGAEGGAGGRLVVRYDVAGIDEAQLHVGERGMGSGPGRGAFDGGDADSPAGGGGGATEVKFDDSPRQYGDAGGGASGVTSQGATSGGGGGARDGEGGSGTNDGDDAEGDGTGNGGDGGSGINDDGEDGGQSYVDDGRVLEVIEETTGGGGEGGDENDRSGGDDGLVVIEITEFSETPEPPDNFAATTVSNREIQLAGDEPADQDDYDEWRIYRDTDPGVTPSGSPHTTLSTGPIDYTDNNLDEGTAYYYVATAWVADDGSGESYESEASDEVSATTDLPAPDQPTLTEVS